MATAFLSASAAYSAAVWWTTSGGATPMTPGTGDSLDLNGNTLTVDQDITHVSIIGVTGTLAVSGNRTLTCVLGDTSSGYSCTLNGASQTVNVVGNVIAGITANRFIVSGASTTLNVTGNSTGGTASTIRGISCSAGAVNLTGNSLGGSATNAAGVIANGGTVTVNGNVTGGSTANVGGYGAQVSSGTLTVNGTVTGGSTASNTNNANFGVLVTGGTFNHTGSRTNSAASAVVLAGGTDNWTPTASHTATLGGKVVRLGGTALFATRIIQ